MRRVAMPARLAVPLAALAGALGGFAVMLLAGAPLWATAALGSAAAAAAVFLALRPLSVTAEGASRLLRGSVGAAPPPGPYAETSRLAEALALAQRLAAANQALGREKQQLLQALDGAAEAVIAVDVGAVVRYANAPAQRLLGRRPTEIEGRQLAWLLPEPALSDAVGVTLGSGRPQERLIERPGRQALEVAIVPSTAEGDWAAVITMKDLAGARRAEQMRRDFIANVSHELRTPLASIRAVLETLEAGALSDADAARDFVARAATEVDRLTNMVTELMELSRLESGEPTARDLVDVTALAREAAERMRPQAERAGLRLECQAQEGLAVIGDGPRLERALLNLLHNAVKFTPVGGEVSLTARRGDGEVLIKVSDTGTGIDGRDLPRIFERFYKADSSRGTDGAGLGLALVKHTVEAHGGKVSVQSEAGRGSTFTLRLPEAGTIPQTAAGGGRAS
jgi:two-component system phosphate regulon sensor histidine kinase PhoR